MNKIEKIKKMKKYEKKHFKKISKKYQKISQNISKNLKISQNVSKCISCCFSNVVLRDWVLYCIFFWTIENLKKPQNPSKYLKISQICWKKEKTRKKQNKLTQPYNNFAEASGRIAAQLSAVIIFPCVVKC